MDETKVPTTPTVDGKKEIASREELLKKQREVSSLLYCTNHIKKYISYRIKRNLNMIIIVVGPTGSGKSESALSLAEQLDPNFDVNKVCFNVEKFLELVNKGKEEMPSGSCVVYDESGVSANNRSWQSKFNKALNFCLQTARYKNHIYFLTLPNLSMLDKSVRQLMHSIFRPIKIMKRQGICVLKPYIVNMNPMATKTDKLYTKFINMTVMNKSKGYEETIKVTRMGVTRPSVKLRHAYEQKKEAFVSALYTELQAEIGTEVEDKPQYTHQLTAKQLSVFKLMQAGNTGKQIAQVLGNTEQNISAIKQAILRKGYSL